MQKVQFARSKLLKIADCRGNSEEKSKVTARGTDCTDHLSPIMGGGEELTIIIISQDIATAFIELELCSKTTNWSQWFEKQEGWYHLISCGQEFKQENRCNSYKSEFSRFQVRKRVQKDSGTETTLLPGYRIQQYFFLLTVESTSRLIPFDTAFINHHITGCNLP